MARQCTGVSGRKRSLADRRRLCADDIRLRRGPLHAGYGRVSRNPPLVGAIAPSGTGERLPAAALPGSAWRHLRSVLEIRRVCESKPGRIRGVLLLLLAESINRRQNACKNTESQWIHCVHESRKLSIRNRGEGLGAGNRKKDRMSAVSVNFDCRGSP